MGVAAAIATGGFGSLVVAEPAHAATAEADIETKVGDNSIQGKAGAKASIGFQVTNHGKIDVGVLVTIQVPGNTEIESADRCTVGGNRRSASCQIASLKAGASANGTIQVLLRTAGEGNGGVAARATDKVTDPKPGNNSAAFKIRIAGASATPTASKTTRASRSASADPADTTGGEVLAPPEAGNGAVPRDDPKTTTASNDSGMSFGFWIGVVAIIAALGLVGSLFYFRRKDRLEPDTGVFHMPTAGHDNPTSVITPGVYGSPAAQAAQAGPAFQNAPGYGQSYGQNFPPGQGFQPGQGAPGGPNVYGAPAAPPAGPMPPGPPPVGPPVPSPGANDQTVLMRRPDDL